MYNSHYFTEIMVKEIERQLMAEADRLRLIKAAKSTGASNGNRVSGSISSLIKSLGTYLRRKDMPSICWCPQD